MNRRWWRISDELAYSVSFQSKHSQLWVVILLCIINKSYCTNTTETTSAERTLQKKKKKTSYNCRPQKRSLTVTTNTYPTGHCAHYHLEGIFYPQHTLRGDQVNLVTWRQQVRTLMVHQYVHWKSKPASNLYQPGRNLEKKSIQCILSWEDFSLFYK